MKYSLLIITITLLSCENDIVTTTIESVYHCHQQKNWTPDQIQQQIAGKWIPEGQNCVWVGEVSIDDQVVYEFVDSTLLIRNQDMIADSFYYQIQFSDGIFRMITNPRSDLSDNYVYVCDDEMICSDVNVDGCAKYFIKE